MGLIMIIRDFNGRADVLASQHSSGCIGRTEGVARSALFLAEAGSSFSPFCAHIQWKTLSSRWR